MAIVTDSDSLSPVGRSIMHCVLLGRAWCCGDDWLSTGRLLAVALLSDQV